MSRTTRAPRIVLTDKCSTCIFRSGNKMELNEGRLRDLTEASLAQDTNVICHQSDGLVGEWKATAWCAGSVEHSPGQTVRVGLGLGIMSKVHPDDMEKADR
jgi:hypothetical protein